MAYRKQTVLPSSPVGLLVTLRKMRPFLLLRCGCDTAVTKITRTLENAGLRVIPSFDSRLTASASTCPHHGQEPCDCQIVILLVYGTDKRPTTLVAHGQDGETWLSIATTPDQRPSPALQTTIQRSLSLLSAAARAE